MSVLAVMFLSLFELITVPERSMFPVAKQSINFHLLQIHCTITDCFEETHNGFMKGTPVYLITRK